MSDSRRSIAGKGESLPGGVTAAEAAKVLGALGGLRYGAVEVVVHDGRIVQIERKEKVRLDR